MNELYIKDKIEKGINCSSVNVTGDGTHFEAIIISSEFNGKNTLERHKMVYSCINGYIPEKIHAISIQAISIKELED